MRTPARVLAFALAIGFVSNFGAATPATAAPLASHPLSGVLDDFRISGFGWPYLSIDGADPVSDRSGDIVVTSGESTAAFSLTYLDTQPRQDYLADLYQVDLQVARDDRLTYAAGLGGVLHTLQIDRLEVHLYGIVEHAAQRTSGLGPIVLRNDVPTSILVSGTYSYFPSPGELGYEEVFSITHNTTSEARTDLNFSSLNIGSYGDLDLLEFGFTSDGSTWSYDVDYRWSMFAESGGLNPIPEPSTALLLGLGLVGLGVRRRN